MAGMHSPAVSASPRHQLTRRRVLGGSAAALALAGATHWQRTAAQGGAPLPVTETDGPMSDDVLEALQTRRAWINYSPARPFDFIAGQHPVTEEQLQAELELLYDHGFAVSSPMR